MAKMRKVEVFAEQLLEEWQTLSEDKKEDSLLAIIKQFVEKVPAAGLVIMAEHFAIAAEISERDLNKNGADVGSAVSARSEHNKQMAKMRKAEVFAEQLLEEWQTLSEDKKEDSLLAIIKQFVEKVPAAGLVIMAEHFAIAAEISERDLNKNGADVGSKKEIPKLAEVVTKAQ